MNDVKTVSINFLVERAAVDCGQTLAKRKRNLLVERSVVNYGKILEKTKAKLTRRAIGR